MRKTSSLVLTVLSLIVFGVTLSSCSESELAVAPAETTQPMARRVINHDGIEREFFVHVPDNAGDNPPLVVAVHGYTSTATGFQATHGVNRNADEHGYVVVYPQGSHFMVDDPASGPYRVTSWNDLASNTGNHDSEIALFDLDDGGDA